MFSLPRDNLPFHFAGFNKPEEGDCHSNSKPIAISLDGHFKGQASRLCYLLMLYWFHPFLPPDRLTFLVLVESSQIAWQTFEFQVSIDTI